MKKIFYLLLLTAITLQGQTTGVNKLRIASNPEKTTAPRVLVQETNGDVGYVAKSSIQTDISGKVDKVAGKELSTNDYTTAEKTKLAGIASGAEVNVNADWNAISGDAQILNKPTIPSIAGLATETFVNNGLSTKENTIAPGTTSQYWRGDKTWQTFDKNVIGLSNIDNTSDLNKPISTATQAALDLKANGSSVVNLTDDQSISGIKTFNSNMNLFLNSDNDYNVGFNIINFRRGDGIYLSNTGSMSGKALHVFNGGAGTGFYLRNLTSSKGAHFVNQTSGPLLTLESNKNSSLATGKLLSILKLNSTASDAVPIEVGSIAHDGVITAPSFIRSGGTSSQFLKADGSVSTINDATGDATYTKQVVAKPDGTLGYENKTSESSTIYTEADCIVDTNLVQLFELLAIKKGRELIINIRFLLKSTAPTANVYTDLITMPAGIVFSKKNVIIGQRWQTNSEVSTLILEGNKIKYFGMNQPKLAFAESYFNATIIID